MSKMIIFSMFIWKKFPAAKVTKKDLISYITTILFCIFLIIPIYYRYHL
jgi:hypothetical protein